MKKKFYFSGINMQLNYLFNRTKISFYAYRSFVCSCREWVSLGRYHLAVTYKVYVEISNKGADNVIAADAVLFIPIKK
ncbi:MAG: hypothetical protein Q8904_06285 [Bacteroidota bacterium]|nr:hypothetical protein [Bacteroidota bacterium]